jgi:effector-binding domain-containing protein
VGEQGDGAAGCREAGMIRLRLLWFPLAALALSLADPSPVPAQTPAPAAAVPNDPFGEQVMLVEKPVVMLSGSGLWESAFETITKALKSVYRVMEQQGIKANGPPMTIYTATDDTGFKFDAAVPVAPATSLRSAGEVKLGKTPTGKALKFIHRGSYDAMDATYEAITNYLDEKNLDSRDLFVEQYMKDPVTTPEDDLVVEIYVPLK